MPRLSLPRRATPRHATLTASGPSFEGPRPFSASSTAQALGDGDEKTDAASFLDGVATLMGGTVMSHMTVGDDMDLVAIEGAVRGLHF